MTTTRELTELEHLKRCSDLERDYRNQRARENGQQLVRRATDRTEITDLEVERIVAERWNLAPRRPLRSEHARIVIDDQVIRGLHEPKIQRATRPSRMQRMVVRVRLAWLGLTGGAA